MTLILARYLTHTKTHTHTHKLRFFSMLEHVCRVISVQEDFYTEQRDFKHINIKAAGTMNMVSENRVNSILRGRNSLLLFSVLINHKIDLL